MQLVNVRDRFITLEVTPEDCILLREACTVAREHLSSHTDHRVGPLLDAFATAFDAAALAGQWTEDGDRSLASFRRDHARHYPGASPRRLMASRPSPPSRSRLPARRSGACCTWPPTER